MKNAATELCCFSRRVTCGAKISVLCLPAEMIKVSLSKASPFYICKYHVFSQNTHFYSIFTSINDLEDVGNR